MRKLKTYFQYLTSLMSKCYCQTILPSRVKCTKINNTNGLLSNFWHCMTRLAASKKTYGAALMLCKEKSVLLHFSRWQSREKPPWIMLFFLESFTFWAIRMEAYSQHIFNYILLSLKTWHLWVQFYIFLLAKYHQTTGFFAFYLRIACPYMPKR